MGSLDVEPQWHPQPTYHLKAPQGWINDPCAPGYDPVTETYHLFYQWNPKSCDWGDICWGHFTSKDGVHWKHNGSEPVLSPSLPYDHKGIFTGCFYPTGPKGEKGQLTVIYSSIQSLPIHWTLSYTRNCAGLALATSSDGGRSWEKSPLNPILEGEPEGLVVTGFRDPYLAEWDAMDRLRGETSLYGIVSGGVVDEGPNAFLYAVSHDDLTTWKYLGRLCDIATGLQRPTHWNGDFGVNWECVNFMTLQGDNKAQKDFLIMGTEGGYKRDVEGEQDPHCVWTMWMAGALTQTENGPQMSNEFGGLLDHGNLYAANSYQHPKTGERIVWGWIKEEELTLSRREDKGWTGYLSIPREVFLYEMTSVTRSLNTPLADISSIKVIEQKDGLATVQTLGVRPLKNLASLRTVKPQVWTNISQEVPLRQLTNTSSTNWEMEAVVSVQPETRDIGFYIHHSHNMSQRTAISFSPKTEEIRVDRCLSNCEYDIVKDPVWGPFTLFVTEEGGQEMMEKLRLRISVDGDVLEVFANDRFALSTVVYADSFSCPGISWFADGPTTDRVVFESISLWEGLSNVQRGNE